MTVRNFYLLLFSVALFSCASPSGKKGETADTRSRSEHIIDSSVVFHGGDKYTTSRIEFGFRQKLYEVKPSAHGPIYSRRYTDSLGVHREKLEPSGFTAILNNQVLSLSAKDSLAKANSLNSVVYFALLPSFLKDPAVHSEYLGKEKIGNTDYYKIHVSFSEEGGGEDFDDEYLYWFDSVDYSMDYLAYSFRENDGGTRFRVAHNIRRVNGIQFQDYTNYAGPGPDSLETISQLYNSGTLKVLSEIALNRLAVFPVIEEE